MSMEKEKDLSKDRRLEGAGQGTSDQIVGHVIFFRLHVFMVSVFIVSPMLQLPQKSQSSTEECFII